MDWRIYATPFTRMAYPVGSRRVYLLELLRRFATTAAATAAGVAHAVMNPNESLVQLKPGDPAPDFPLCRDLMGILYRLKDLAGRSRRHRLVSESVHGRLSGRVQVARVELTKRCGSWA